MNFIMSLLSSNGKVSSTRFITLATAATILITYIAHNIVSMHRGQSYIDFPTNSVAVLAIVLGAKVGQHVSEQKAAKPTETP